MRLAVYDLKKRYGDFWALKGVSFEVLEGSITALLGPNGAGKTTTINILTGLLRQTEGKVIYGDKVFSQRERTIKKIIGVVPQYNNVDKDLTVIENWYIHALLYKVPKNKIKDKIDEMLEFTGLANHKNKKANALSGGMKRRLVIGRALLHEPKILFLDEPTAGLDPAVRRHLWDFIKIINNKFNCTVLLTTHYIEEAERLADKVIILDKGKIIKRGSPHNLKKEIGEYVLELFDGERTKYYYFKNKSEALKYMEQLKNYYQLNLRVVNLEDVFLQVTGKRIDV